MDDAMTDLGESYYSIPADKITYRDLAGNLHVLLKFVSLKWSGRIHIRLDPLGLLRVH